MVTLEPLEPEDLELLYTIENDREMWSVGNTNVPYSRYALKEYIANQQYDIFADKQLRMVIRDKELTKSVGLIDLFNFSPEHSRAELGLAILKAEQGRGYATEAIRQMLRYANEVLHLYQVYCIVPADNAPSLTMLRTSGFGNEATLPGWIQTAEGFKDAVFLSILL